MYCFSANFCIKNTILGEKYLFNKTTGEIYDLNNTAVFILENIVNRNIPEIIALAKREYEIEDYELFEKEVRKAIKEYCKMGIIRQQSSK